MAKIIGIDLGTTNSVVAVMEGGNPTVIANAEGNPDRWFAYPRWTRGETAIVYHASPSLYMYTLADESTVKVSTEEGADYRYPHCEATPK